MFGLLKVPGDPIGEPPGFRVDTLAELSRWDLAGNTHKIYDGLPFSHS